MIRITACIMAVILVFAATSWAQGYDALVRQAEKKLGDKKYAEALELYEKAFATGEFHYKDFYNAACASTRLDDPDKAFAYLDRAVAAGLIEKQWLEQDEDLKGLHKDKRWEAFMAGLQAKLMEIEKAFTEKHTETELIDLPTPRFESEVSVEEAMKNRRSIRSYEDTPLTIAEVTQLLWAAYGITKKSEKYPAFVRGGLRTAPSAGARFPLDVYLVVRNVDGLDKGVYLYKSETHQLVTVVKGDKWADLSEAGFNQTHFQTAAAALVYSAVFERNMVKYGQRGRERYVCMDLGHSAQNVYLQAYALNIGTCAIGAFTDLWLKQVTGMTRNEEPLYIMPLGKVKASE